MKIIRQFFRLFESRQQYRRRSRARTFKRDAAPYVPCAFCAGRGCANCVTGGLKPTRVKEDPSAR